MVLLKRNLEGSGASKAQPPAGCWHLLAADWRAALAAGRWPL
jgi:hypothetical protein